MKSRIMAQGNPTPLEPRWPNTNIPTSQPLPAGSTVATTVERTTRFDEAKAAEYLQLAGKALQQAETIGIEVPNGIDFTQALAMISAGAGIGAIGGPIGVGIGAAVGLITYAITWLQGNGGNTTYPNQQVAFWAQHHAEQAFVDWAVQNQTNTWSTIEQAAQAQLLYWAERWNCILVAYRDQNQVYWPAGDGQAKFYNGIPDMIQIGWAGGNEKVAELYKQIGVDYYATRDMRIAAQNAGYDITAQYKMNVTVPRGQADDTRNPDGSNTGTDGDGDNTAAIVVGVAALAAVALSSRSNS